METLGLKNINLLTKEQYDGIAEPAKDELWAVEVDSGGSVPDYSAGVSVICPIQDAPFVAPCDGVYVTNFAVNNTSVSLYIDGVQSGFSHSNAGSNRDYLSHFIPLPKGATIYWSGSAATVSTSMFYPFKGVN